MEEVIAKRYIKAFTEGMGVDELKKFSTLFSTLTQAFSEKKFNEIMCSPNVTSEQKIEILTEVAKKAESQKITNFLKVLVEKKRISLIPAIAECLRKDIAAMTKTYSGTVYSNSEIEAQILKDLSSGLGGRFGSSIELEFVKSDFDGIKVDVADLGVEINFSRTRINDQIIEHIVKAI